MELLKIGFLYDHPFGERVINHLINKQQFCTRCGPLCISCRDHYDWFAGKIHYVKKVDYAAYDSIEECLPAIEEKLFPLDVLVVVGIPEELISVLPSLLQKHHIRAIIVPVEDGQWLSPSQQIFLQSECKRLKIQYAFPRPFCSLALDPSLDKSIINDFIDQFHIGKPKLHLNLKGNRIVNAQILCSAPCGATYYIAQYLRNEALNTWNTDSLEKRITVALKEYPCIAAHTRDPLLQAITFVVAEKNNQDAMRDAFQTADKSD